MTKKKTPGRRFEATEATIHRDLRSTITRLNALNLRLDYDLLGHDPGVRIFFDRAEKRYVSECHRWPHYLDNMRAAQLAIDYTFRIAEAYGVDFAELEGPEQEIFDQVFGGMQATTPDMLLLGSGNNWWDVLGVSRTASRAEIVNAYRALVKIHHPDVGGDAEQFKRLRAAYEKALGERS